MARGYRDGDRAGSTLSRGDPPSRPPPSRPARRIDSVRGRGDDSSYHGGHYAESPVVVNQRPPTSTMSDGHSLQVSTLPRTSVQPLYLPQNGPTTVAKVTRSRSLSSRPAGVAVFHTPGRAESRSVMMLHEQAGRSQPPSRPATRMSSKSHRSHATGVSGVSTTPGKNTTKAGVVIETMSAPNPFCPNTRGVCCLMVLVNLALILVAIGFIIVLQLPEPAVVWNIGVVILAAGFATFFVALLYCMCICQEARYHQEGKPQSGELFWTHHWQKNITIPEIKTREKERWAEQDHFPEDDAVSESSSRDYPKLYLESDYGQRTDREADFETEHETGGAVDTIRSHHGGRDNHRR